MIEKFLDLIFGGERAAYHGSSEEGVWHRHGCTAKVGVSMYVGFQVETDEV
jgi:hypothetical protein